jgi:hypothetical protein
VKRFGKYRRKVSLIGIIWKKDMLNSEKLWKIWRESKLNSEKIGKIWKKDKLNGRKVS